VGREVATGGGLRQEYLASFFHLEAEPPAMPPGARRSGQRHHSVVIVPNKRSILPTAGLPGVLWISCT